MDNERLMHMSHALLNKITDGFSEERILGRGTFGVVFKGETKDGQEIAVKVLNSMKGVDDEEFRREFNNLTKLKHQNIVQLLGFCNETEKVTVEYEGKQIIAERIHRALCFEYMHNGSLQKHLSDEYQGFGWHRRYKIIRGICEGLKYLHEGMQEPIYHLDLKPDNILLDMNMAPKIADFGLSRLLGEENTQRTITGLGTLGYAPPEYVENQIVSNKFDIFSLGVIVIKIIVGPTRHASIVDMKDDEFLEHVCKKWRERLYKEPESTLPEIDCQQVKKCIEMALMCIKKEMNERPTIAYLVDQLNETEKHQCNPAYSIKEFDEREDINTKSTGTAMLSPEMATDSTGGKIPENNQNIQGPLQHALPLEYLKKITNGFSKELKLSEDAFGTLYKGTLEDGQVIAVKKLADHSVIPAGKRFTKEVRDLMQVQQHENLLKIISCCSEAKDKLLLHEGRYILLEAQECVLCYEYAAKGSLVKYLSDDTRRTDWATHFKIIKGICQGLHFLHGKTGGPVVHMDLQPANILLDNNMVPKIANFGLSRFFNQQQTRLNTLNVVGAKGYMSPEYLYLGEISPQCDIYSLGVLILEITTREKNRSSDKDMAARNFIATIRQTWTDEHIASKYSSLDPDDIQEVKTCIDIGLKCVDVAQKNRPSIEEVFNRLSRKRVS